MMKSNLVLVVTLFVLLLASVHEAGRAVPPSGPSHKGPYPPVANLNLWSPSQRLVFGMLPKYVPIPPSGPSRGLSPGTPPPRRIF
ncbi:unnamed protein product [Cochlearia groenlandica]